MSSGLTAQEMAYLQSSLQSIGSYPSGSIGDQGNSLANSINTKLRTGQLTSAASITFVVLTPSDITDMGTF